MITINLPQIAVDVKLDSYETVEILAEDVVSEPQGWIKVMHSTIKDKSLSDGAHRTLELLKTFAYNKTTIWPTHKTLAKERGVSERTLSRHKAELVKLGYITMTERRDQNLSTLIVLRNLDALSAKNGSVPHDTINVSTPKEDRPDVKTGLLNKNNDSIHDDDDEKFQIFGSSNFVQSNSWGIEVLFTNLIETKSHPTIQPSVEPMVVIQAQPLGQGTEFIPPPNPNCPDLVAKQALLSRLPLDPGPTPKKLAEVLPMLSKEYITKWVKFYETEIALEKSRFYRPLGFVISGLLAGNQEIPANTAPPKAKATKPSQSNSTPKTKTPKSVNLPENSPMRLKLQQRGGISHEN